MYCKREIEVEAGVELTFPVDHVTYSQGFTLKIISVMLYMERVPESKAKALPGKLPIVVELPNTSMTSKREVGQASSMHRGGLVREQVNRFNGQSSRDLDLASPIRTWTQKDSLSKQVGQAFDMHKRFARVDLGHYNGRDSRDSDSPAPIRTWKGKDSLPEPEELMTDVLSFEGSGDSFDEGGTSLFCGASHPPEPVDTDLMRQVYVPIGQTKSEASCLMKSMSVKGPFLEDLSIRVPAKKPSPAVLSPAESIVEEPNDMVTSSPPFSVLRASQNTDNSLLPPDSEENECVWDASLPPSGNVSPYSSIDSMGVVTAMSIVNSCSSTYRSDTIMSDGLLSLDRNCEGTKGSVRGDLLESAKTSLSRASHSSGLSDDSNWSNFTGSANKPHKGNDPSYQFHLDDVA
ncbi:hypothetical protein HS088_TW18G00290 [Tripterygium wilfordii]|uniref:Uncharacterized protein n=1 Tax=Tripterygium wilfordii TaxID=458696 RepID=A0A7J7CBV8_TRIWF|nr:hypothetical protein HS088_TW18G00290 [Tripterygium wilfordii]